MRTFIAFGLMALASAANAQVGGFQLDRFRPAHAAEGIIDVPSARVGAHLDVDAGLLLDYSVNPLVLYPDGGGQLPIVGHRVGAHLVFAIGLFDWVRIGVDLPVTAYQSAPDEGVPLSLRPSSTSAFALGDLRLTPSLRVLRQEDVGVDVLARVDTTVPTNFPRDQYAGESGFSVMPELVVGRAFRSVHVDALFNIGYRVRPRAELANFDVGHELQAALGLRFNAGRLVDDLAGVRAVGDLAAEASTTFAVHTAPFSDDIAELPAEFKFGLTYPFMNAFVVEGGIGAGLGRGVGAPDVRVLFGLRYQKRSWDRDGDGIDDAEDQCPDAREDRDRFQDWDGCPDEDNDGDGVLDLDDECSFVVGTGPNGCPTEDRDLEPDPEPDPDPDTEPEPVPVPEPESEPEPTPEPVPEREPALSAEVLQARVYFVFSTSRLTKASRDVVDEVAAYMRANPSVKIRVEGHTDSTGSARANLRLSSSRASQVRRQLIERGIGAERLSAKGYGETVPIAPNATARGRDQNRRVEFRVVVD